MQFLKFNKPRYALISLLIFSIANAFYFFNAYNSALNIKCSGYVNYYTQQDDFGYDVVISMNLHSDASGLFSVEGIMNKANSKWILNRDIAFNYRRLQTNDIKLENVKIIKHGRDNSPDNIFSSNFIHIKKDGGIIITLAKVVNGYIIGTQRAPIFTCLPE